MKFKEIIGVSRISWRLLECHEVHVGLATLRFEDVT